MIRWHEPVESGGGFRHNRLSVSLRRCAWRFGKESMNIVFRLWKESLHLLYPVRCPICDRPVFVVFGRWEYPICPGCREAVDYVREPACKKCGKPLSDIRAEFCGDCLRQSHLYDQGKALWLYKGYVKQSIYRLKYGNRREYGISYGQELVRVYGDWIRKKEIQLIIPIPLHKKRLRQRGFNQAEVIAKEIGRQMKIPVRKDLLIRCVHTRPQKELNDKERKNNLKKAFKIAPNNVQLNQILLVDDIYTTGSTMDRAAGVLKEAGASQVCFVSVSIGRGY